MPTTTATPEEPEQFKLSDAETQGITRATGVRPDIVRSLRGDSYADVKANAEKLADIYPQSKVASNPAPFPQPSVIGAESMEIDPKAVAIAIRRRLGIPPLKGGK